MTPIPGVDTVLTRRLREKAGYQKILINSRYIAESLQPAHKAGTYERQTRGQFADSNTQGPARHRVTVARWVEYLKICRDFFTLAPAFHAQSKGVIRVHRLSLAYSSRKVSSVVILRETKLDA
jgi:hypothetical protein